WTQTRDEWCKARLFRTLCGWKPSGDLLQALKLGLHDEDLKCRWASAESLAKLYSGNDEVKNELSQKVRMWPDLEVRAAALYCLWKGWPNYEALNEYAEVASKSICQSFAIAGVLIKISKNQHSDIDLEKICQMYFTRTVDYDLEGICCELLVKGWGGDEKLKEKVLIELDLKFNQGVFEVERFISFLVRAWPGDNDVANHVVRYVKKYSIAMMHGSGLWQAIISGFGGNKELINAIRDVLIERKEKYKAIYWGPDTKNAYLAIGDDVAKKEMLEAYSQVDSIMDKHWICSTLMTGWKNDPEVQRFFSLEFLKPPVENAILANWVHVFINDKDARRSWLLGAITTGNDRGVLSAVGRLLDEFNDEECIDTVKDILTKKNTTIIQKLI
ncbi:TPA: HEAT repeat domain-containing protein, partial [Enterobacter kobei]|nr:HEAT repeat domain-containing protein [Enterobacter kobei]